MDWTKLKEEKEKDKNRFYLIVAGSRGFLPFEKVPVIVDGESKYIFNQELADFFIDKILSKHVAVDKEIILYDGDARGADQVGKNYADRHGYSRKAFIANWEKLGKRAGYERNEAMYRSASMHPNKAAFLLWDGESRGTRHNFICGRFFNSFNMVISW